MLTDKELRQLKKFGEDLSLPKWKYVLFTGVLAWGVTVALLVSIFSLLFEKVGLKEFFSKHLWRNLITAMIGGVFVGLMMHWLIKKQVKKLKEKEASPE